MSQPSSWPLPPDGIRFFVPQFMVDRLAADPLTRDLYPLCLGYYPSAAGHHAERPEHDDHLLIYCVEGAGTLEMAGRRRRIGPGDLVLLRKGTSHRYRADASDPWTLYWVHCDGERADRYLDMLDLDPETPVLSLGVLPKLIADMEALTDVRETGYNPAEDDVVPDRKHQDSAVTGSDQLPGDDRPDQACSDPVIRTAGRRHRHARRPPASASACRFRCRCRRSR